MKLGTQLPWKVNEISSGFFEKFEPICADYNQKHASEKQHDFNRLVNSALDMVP